MIKINPNQQTTTVNLRLQEVLAACGKAKEPKVKSKRTNGNKETKESNEIKNKIKGETKEMTNEMKVFNFKENEVRTEVKDNEIWFVAKDVCEVLEIVNPTRALAGLEDDEKGLHTMKTLGGNQELLVVNEPGLYSLVIRSRKPEAKEFKRWITHDVIPSIRKHGAYMTPATLDEFIANPNFGIKLLTSLQEEREARKALELQSAQQQQIISELEPKASHYDQWINGTGYYSLNTVAKLLGTGRNRMIKQLKTLGFLTKERVPYQRHMGNGKFVVKVVNLPTGDSTKTTLVSPKGVEYIAKITNSVRVS